MKYKRKPETIDAIQFTKDNLHEVEQLCNVMIRRTPQDPNAFRVYKCGKPTSMTLYEGSYLCKRGKNGELLKVLSKYQIEEEYKPVSE